MCREVVLADDNSLIGWSFLKTNTKIPKALNGVAPLDVIMWAKLGRAETGLVSLTVPIFLSRHVIAS